MGVRRANKGAVDHGRSAAGVDSAADYRESASNSFQATTADPPQSLVGNSIDPVWRWILDFVKTLDATGGIKPFPDYPFAQKVVEALIGNRILIIAKSRQMMATWTVAATTLYRALYESPGLYLFLSKGARDSGELVKRLRIMTANLPEDVGAGIKIKSGEASFPNGSRILSLPATEFAPRMHSPTGVFWDEMAFTPNSEGIWASLKPAIDSGGFFAGVSSPNGTDNIFHSLFTDASNGFGKLKLHYSEHPLRGDDWTAEARKGLSEARWKQEYEVDFNVLADRVYDEFDSAKHIISAAFDPRSPGRIYRGIDFGYHHPYVVWLHQTPDGLLTIFGEWEGEDATVEELSEAIRREDKRLGIVERQVTFTGCDPAGAAVSESGLSPVARLGQEGIKLVHKPSLISYGVDLVKSLLCDANGVVRLTITSNCERTIDHFRHYRWDKGSDHPCKDDGHDHAMDAVRYAIINIKGKPASKWSGAMVRGSKR